MEEGRDTSILNRKLGLLFGKQHSHQAARIVMFF